MKTSLRSISFRVDPWWLIFVGVIGLLNIFSLGPLPGVFQTLGLVAVYGLVIIHEYGHAWAAQKCGMTVDSITVWPLGGLARIRGIEYLSPKEDLFISFAGPATHVIMVVVGGMFWIAGFQGNLLYNFLLMNTVLFVFNMLPAYPLDGGRMLKAGLSLRMPEHKALKISARIGQGLAVGLAICGVAIPGVMLILISIFIFVACENALKNNSNELM